MKSSLFATGLLMLASPHVYAAIPVLAPVDLSGCVNYTVSNGAPVGLSKGNTTNTFAHLSFYLPDPSAGNNTWTAGAGALVDIRVSVPSPVSVYLMINTIWSQAGIANATVTFLGASGLRHSVQLIGDKEIRDSNNDVWGNTINETTTQEWWTNNMNPHYDDQTKRQDVHGVGLSMFAGDTLTDIIVSAPATAGQNYMQPLLFAVGINTGTGVRAIASRCVPS